MKNNPISKGGEGQDGSVSHFINPGEFYFGDSKSQIHTLLGSCIAITLWHPHLKIGGMCHFVLSGERRPDGVNRAGEELNGRYSDDAMALFQKAAMKHGTNLNDYQAKIFGGSNMLAQTTLKEDELIGTKNTEAALHHLSERDIPLLVAHVGETGHRRIAFDLATGDVWVKHEPLQKVIDPH